MSQMCAGLPLLMVDSLDPLAVLLAEVTAIF